MNSIMPGKTLFVVNLHDHVNEIAQDLLDGKYQGVAIKVCHGGGFSQSLNPSDMDLFVEIIDGQVDIYGWHWNLGISPELEADIAAQAIDRWGLQAYMMNYEAPMKDHPEAQVPLLQHFRARKPDHPLGLCSYRYPNGHPGILWDDILPFFDFHAPQVYWVLKHDPVAQLEKSMEQLLALRDLPIIPVGAAFTDPGYHPWKPTPEDLRAFDAACQEKGLQGAQYFTWRSAKPLGLLPVLAELSWDVEPPPEPPVVDCQEAIDAAVAEVTAMYEARIKQLEDEHIVELLQTAKKANNEALQSLIGPYLK